MTPPPVAPTLLGAQTPRRQPLLRRALAALLATALAILGAAALVAAPATASGVEDNAITGISFYDGDGNPVTEAWIYSGVHVKATWTATSTAQPGDFFTISWPPTTLQGVPEPSFEIFDDAYPSRGAVATCAVVAESLTCVYTDYVATYDNVSGTVEFSAQLREATQEIRLTANGSAEFRIDLEVSVPPEDGYVPPARVDKFGDTDYGLADIYWEFDINPAAFPGVPVLKVEDLYDLSNTLVDGSWMIHWRPAGTADWLELDPETDYTSAFFPDDHRFTVDIVNAPARQDGAYVVRYHTDVPGDAERGDTFSNTVTVSGESLTAEMEWTMNAGGNGSGNTFGTFEIVKAFADAQAAAAGADAVFTGQWSCTVPGPDGDVVEGTWEVTGAGAATLTQTTQNPRFPQLPLDTLCSTTEDGTPQGWAAGVSSTPVAITRTLSTLTVTNALREQDTAQLTIEKLLQGDDEMVVTPQVYSGSFTCTDGDTTLTDRWAVEAGGTFTSEQIPAGMTCSVTEETPGEVEGATWAAPVYSGDVTIQPGTEPTVTVTNVVTADEADEAADKEPVPDAPDSAAPLASPDPTPRSGVAGGSGGSREVSSAQAAGLAQTGAQVAVVATGALLLTAVGGVLLLRSRRRAQR